MSDQQVTETRDSANFSQFGDEFQEVVVQALMYDHKWAQQMSEVLKVEHFDKKYLQYLAQRYFEYFSKYKCFPSLKILVSFIRDELKLGHDVIVRDMIVAYLKRIKDNPNVGDMAWVKDKALDFCRRQSMKEALYQSVDLINEGKYESVVGVMREALSVGDLPSVGHMFFDDIEARLTPINRNVVPTGLKQLDAKGIFSGGLGKGELGVIVGNTGTGKCTTAPTCIRIRYEQIKINGCKYRPWDRVNTARGVIFAKEIREDDELI